MSRRIPHAEQLGFDELLTDAARDNDTREAARACAHLPGTFNEAVPFFRDLIEQHHAAMLAGDIARVMHLREEAHSLAVKLNNYEAGILADDESPGYTLARATQAPDGEIPLWGQTGSFEISCGGMRVRIEMEGLFGIATSIYHWLGFAAYAVDYDRPFLSETGYRSFVAIGGELKPGFTPEGMASKVIAAYLKRHLKDRLASVDAGYLNRNAPASAKKHGTGFWT